MKTESQKSAQKSFEIVILVDELQVGAVVGRHAAWCSGACIGAAGLVLSGNPPPCRRQHRVVAGTVKTSASDSSFSD